MTIDATTPGCRSTRLGPPRARQSRETSFNDRRMGPPSAGVTVGARIKGHHRMTGTLQGRAACPEGKIDLDQAVSQGVSDRVRPVAQVQPAGDVVEDVLNR